MPDPHADDAPAVPVPPVEPEARPSGAAQPGEAAELEIGALEASLPPVPDSTPTRARPATDRSPEPGNEP